MSTIISKCTRFEALHVMRSGILEKVKCSSKVTTLFWRLVYWPKVSKVIKTLIEMQYVDADLKGVAPLAFLGNYQQLNLKKEMHALAHVLAFPYKAHKGQNTFDNMIIDLAKKYKLSMVQLGSVVIRLHSRLPCSEYGWLPERRLYF